MKSRSRLLLCVVLLLAGLLWFTERNRRNLASTVTSPETRAATQSLIALNHAAANASDKVVIMATGDSDYVAWSTKYLSSWHHTIYCTTAQSDPNFLSLPSPDPGAPPRANDSIALLTYIIDNYTTLPRYMAFIRPTRSKAIHGTHYHHANAVALHDLKLSYVDTHGFANLRCSRNPGCDPAAVVPMRHRRANPNYIPPWQARMPDIWPMLFGYSVYPAGGVIATPSGGEFVVADWAVRKRRKEEYDALRRFVIEESQATALDDQMVREMFDTIWHVIFGLPAVYCEDEYTCACERFGRCSD